MDRWGRRVRDAALIGPVALALLAAAAWADPVAPPPADPDVDVVGKAPKKPAPDQSQGVMVTAPRKVALPLLTEPVVETPQTITLITQQEIELAGRSDLRDVLR